MWARQAPSPPLERRCQGRIRRLCAQEMGRPPHLAPFSQNESLVLAPQTLVLPLWFLFLLCLASQQHPRSQITLFAAKAATGSAVGL